MMLLYSAPASPFGRKVKMTARLKGLMDHITVEAIDTSRPDNPALRSRNPLQKIPVLILEDGTEFYDSRVICEYLDSLAPSPPLFPATGRERFDVLCRGALADGIMEAALLLVYEKRFRTEEQRSEVWTARQQSKIDAALDGLELDPPSRREAPDYAHVALAAALGYLDFRHEGRWRASRPKLLAWLERFDAEVPAFGETRPA
mgnify:CR=1 FL=1